MLFFVTTKRVTLLCCTWYTITSVTKKQTRFVKTLDVLYTKYQVSGIQFPTKQTTVPDIFTYIYICRFYVLPTLPHPIPPYPTLSHPTPYTGEYDVVFLGERATDAVGGCAEILSFRLAGGRGGGHEGGGAVAGGERESVRFVGVKVAKPCRQGCHHLIRLK